MALSKIFKKVGLTTGMQTLIHYPSLVNDTFNSFMHQFIIRVLTPSLTERLMASFNLVLTFESVD